MTREEMAKWKEWGEEQEGKGHYLVAAYCFRQSGAPVRAMQLAKKAETYSKDRKNAEQNLIEELKALILTAESQKVIDKANAALIESHINLAQSFEDFGDYSSAAEHWSQAGRDNDARRCRRILEERSSNAAKEAENRGDYKQAAINWYCIDRKDDYKRCYRKAAEQYEKTKNYEEAAKCWEELGEKENACRCREARAAQKVKNRLILAAILLAAGAWAGAYVFVAALILAAFLLRGPVKEYLAARDTHKPSAADAERSQKEAAAAQNQIQRLKANGEYKFGNYRGKGIEWLVLERKPDRMLLLSKEALDTKPFHEKDGPVTWETCTLRQWLNGEFLREAFSEDERERIILADVPAHKNPRYDTDPGRDTKDKVFLLSYEEAERYLPADEQRRCFLTESANALGVTGDNGCCVWWLRSPGSKPVGAACVSYDGSLRSCGRVSISGAVRPALWIHLNEPVKDNIAAKDKQKQAAAADAERLSAPKQSSAVNEQKQTVQLKSEEDFKFGKWQWEDIAWLVLECRPDRMLLLSKHALANRPYNYGNKATWERCTLRQWLNGEFLRVAFSKEERERIIPADVPAHKNPRYDTDPGRDTKDKVFLLSCREALEYLPADEQRSCGEWWWLRSPGDKPGSAALVSNFGSLSCSGRGVVSDYAVRPALWINLGS